MTVPVSKEGGLTAEVVARGGWRHGLWETAGAVVESQEEEGRVEEQVGERPMLLLGQLPKAPVDVFRDGGLDAAEAEVRACIHRSMQAYK
jgi:hypothetical protein